MDAGNRSEKEQIRVHIRWMIRRDMPEVLQTEQASFEFSWTDEDFLRCLRQRNCIGMVAEQGEKVVGYMIYELHKAKLHILNFAVHPTCRRLGVAAQMVAKLISKLCSHRRTKITLEVREINLTAQLFFRSQGFLALRVLKTYYEDSGEDAFLMQYQLAPAQLWSTRIEYSLSRLILRSSLSRPHLTLTTAEEFGCAPKILSELMDDFGGFVLAPESAGKLAYAVLPTPKSGYGAADLQNLQTVILGLFPKAPENANVEFHDLIDGAGKQYLVAPLDTPIKELIGSGLELDPDDLDPNHLDSDD